MRTRGLLAALLVGVSSAAFAVAWPWPQQAPATAPETDEDRLALYEESLDELWGSWGGAPNPDAERPEIDDVRELPMKERDAAFAQCLEDVGFTVTEYAAGFEYVGPADIDQETLVVEQFRCEARFPYEGTLDALLSVQQRSALYDYYTGFLPACLGFAGAESNVPPPSRESFIDTSVMWPSWTPYAAVWNSGLDDDRLAELERRCPSEPAWRRQADLFAAAD